MKKVRIGLAMALTALLAQVEADVLVDMQEFLPASSSQSATFSSLDATVVSSGTSISNMVPSGSFSASDMGSAETFGVTVSGADDWNYATATGPGSVNAYLSSLTYVDIYGSNNGWGLSASATKEGFLATPGEALVMTFDLSGLTAEHQSNFRFKGLGFGRVKAGIDSYNYMVIDASGDVITASASGVDIDILSLDIALNDGDSLVIGNETFDTMRLADFTVDVIPEPATLGLVGMAGAVLLGIRRRLML
ncbi:PEP-CTERM sorting domain-containing protein [Pontiella sulfatireligans]|uniref:PEP-CTERM protein-sorting domain-containing protein n=1 Tax=Pontiella sulfatireligans TaxID=2750658 RepID=A0A6C2UKT0_9BACT|nr:PEP-CTERM sorting domain-containing protein [Pontiella sulfatireligans]VGO20850.1 hypothetical protein SCARR_02917 [Pontiella sulfatireligans]